MADRISRWRKKGGHMNYACGIHGCLIACAGLAGLNPRKEVRVDVWELLSPMFGHASDLAWVAAG